MSLLDTIRQWDEGAAAVGRKDWATALKVFSDIVDKNSKIYFNIGILYLITKDLDAAEKAFDNSIRKDEHLAVAFFQRGITFYKQQKFEEALSDFKKAFTELRGNQLIDYKLLGLRYKLYGCEVLHNVALAHAQLGQWEKAEENLHTALNLKTEAKHSLIDRALESILKHKLFDIVEAHAGEVFRPNKQHVAELEKKDYLGKATVVASIIPKDDFSGFAPLQPQVRKQLKFPFKYLFFEILRLYESFEKENIMLPVMSKNLNYNESMSSQLFRALEGEPHRVRYEFIPETTDELPVQQGNIVFVLQKGADNWAKVFFNGKTGLVPYNFLEPVELTLTSKQEQQDVRQTDSIPAPPSGEPPVRPVRGKGHIFFFTKNFPICKKMNIAHRQNEGAHFKITSYYIDSILCPQEEKSKEPKMCIVKVHATYTVAVSLKPGISYTAVLEAISKKLNQPRGTISLSYKKHGTEKAKLDESEMENAWKEERNGHLTLWCELTENIEMAPKDESPQVVAVYSYEASQPEDLQFNSGDVITVISKVNEEWFEGKCKGKVGIFPAAFVKDYKNKG
ncbi:NCF2 factor, partial [Atractosteus spatula]|nr:NCF2 factor [Atractosteus spatula]